jgi:hypothetical protein
VPLHHDEGHEPAEDVDVKFAPAIIHEIALPTG